MWRRNKKNIIQPGPGPAATSDSTVTCVEELKTASFCRMQNVDIDFTRMVRTGISRAFKPGFIQTFGEFTNSSSKGSPPPKWAPYDIDGKIHRGTGTRPVFKTDEHACDIMETRPTFVMSNDDIYNIGHYMNDVMAVWAASVLAETNTKQAVLLNIDGVRRRGPAGLASHRLMNTSNPDEHGPYRGYYDSWFQEQQRGVQYSNSKVCFKEVYFQALPGIAWFWGDWGLVTPCSIEAPSPLYQSFALFLRRRWIEDHGRESLPDPDTDKVHVVIELRSINLKKSIAKQSSSRHIRNHEALKKRLEKNPKLRVTVQDFAKLPFEEQVALSHSAGVFVSMHGAGTTHIYHMALGKQNCCGLVELFPDKTIEFHAAQGYGNLARHLGLHHTRYVSPQHATTVDGTNVDVEEVAIKIEQVAEKVRVKPSCLHDVRDTRDPIATKSKSNWLPWDV